MDLRDRAIARRVQLSTCCRGAIIQVCRKTLDFSALELRVGNTAYGLTLMEIPLLRYLISKGTRLSPASRYWKTLGIP